MPQYKNLKEFDKALEQMMTPKPTTVPLIQKLIQVKQLRPPRLSNDVT